jgi:hypothetical protein
MRLPYSARGSLKPIGTQPKDRASGNEARGDPWSRGISGTAVRPAREAIGAFDLVKSGQARERETTP